MEHYVGLEVSLKLTAICIIDREDRARRCGCVRPGGDRDIHQMARPICRPDWARHRSNVDVVVDRAE
jgi:hypothetical protein